MALSEAAKLVKQELGKLMCANISDEEAEEIAKFQSTDPSEWMPTVLDKTRESSK